MIKPLVSVAMAVCNVECYLPESIESILGQTFEEFEFIIVDFGSTDNSKAVVAKYAAADSRIKLVEIPKCSLPEARNAGCFLAQGDYIAIADADDVSLPNRMLWQMEFMENHPEVGVLGGAIEFIDAQGRPLVTTRHPLENHELQAALRTHSVFWQPAVLIRKEAFVRVGGYRTLFTYAHDYDLWLRIAESFQIANLEQVVLRYRIHPSQVSLRKQRQQTVLKLAAQASAAARRGGVPDPVTSVQEITPEVLTAWGVSDARQQNQLVTDSLDWTRNMYEAGEYAAALQALLEIEKCDLRQVERSQMSDLFLAIARLCWQEKRYLRGVHALTRSFIARPGVAEIYWQAVLRRFGWVQ